MARPLCITDDPHLLDDVLELATEAGLEFDVTADPATAGRAYGEAPIVVIGAGSTGACAEAHLPHRSGVFVVTREASTERLRPIARLLGAERVVPLPNGTEMLLGRFIAAAELAEQLATRAGQVVAVLGGRGGAGASVLAAGLAITAAGSGLRTMLLDADPLGGGVDLAVGWDAERADLTVLSCARGVPDGQLGGLSADAMRAAIEDGRTNCDLVVADLPRRLDDAAVAALETADRVFLLVPAELRACAAAARVAEAAALHTEALELVVRAPGPGRLRSREIARALDLPLVGTMRSEPGLSRALERGLPPAGTGRGPLAVLCRRLLDGLISDCGGPSDLAQTA
jgi:Mrp family chromosome partitioning ATPase